MKKITVVMLTITILLLAGCVTQQSPEPVKPAQITLSQIGTSGSLHNETSAWGVLDLSDYDLWVLYIKKDRLATHLNSGEAYAVVLDGQNFLLQSNPFNANVVKLLLPSQDKPKDLLSLVIKPINARESGMMKNEIPLAIEKIYITKEENNGTLLNEITVVDYTDMYADSNQNNFAWDNGSFIRPTHVKSNEENAYANNTYFDARTAADTESATGAFAFLKTVANYEDYIVMENPNRFRVTGESTELLEPDGRWRIRQLGQEGELNLSPVFNIIDDETNQQFILSIDKDTLPATYNGTFFWITQFKEATETPFDQTEQTNIFSMTIPYTDAPSREIVLNSRFTGIVDRIIRVNETGEYQGSYQVLNTAIADATNKDRIKIAGDTVLSPTNEQAEIAGEIEINDKELTITTFTGTNATLDWEESGKGFSLTNHASLSLNRLNIINCKNEEPNEAAAINMSEFSVLNVNHTLLASNTGDMGAIYAFSNSKLNIKNASITNNIGTNLMFGTIIVHGARLNVTDSYFASNSAKGSGGGLCIVSSVNATIKGSEFINNCAGQNGAGISVTFSSVVTIDDCFFEGNSFTSNEETDHFGAGIFIDTTFLRNKVTGSTFKNMEAQKGAGIYIQDGELTLYDNSFENLNTTIAGGAVFVGRKQAFFTSARNGSSYTYPTLYNEAGDSWKWFNAPAQTVDFVENTTSNNNTYIDCSVGDSKEAEGAKIYHAEKSTPNGTLTLRPHTAEEQSMMTLDIDYLIATEFKGGTLTIDVPEGFEIGDNASVTIGDAAPKNASEYDCSQQKINITGIDLENGTVTLTLQKQEVPTSSESNQQLARDVDYTFRAVADADGSSTAWTSTDESNAVFTSTEISEFAGGSGTIDDPYQIANFTHLNNMRNYLDAHFILIDNIGSESDPELSDTNERGYRYWIPIGSVDTPFTGSFDGRGHYIGGLAMTSDEDLLLGFYLYTNGAVIENLTLSYFKLSGKNVVGALTGYASGTTFKDINIKNGSFQGISEVGSVSGSCNKSIFENIQMTGYINVFVTCEETSSRGEGDFAGGLVGSCYASTITNSSFRGEQVLAKGNHVGGLVGSLHDSVVSSSYVIFANTGGLNYVSGEGSVGGFVGSSQTSTITNCFAQVDASGTEFVGGFVGCNRKTKDSDKSTIINAYSTGKVIGDVSVGGFCGLNDFEDSDIKNCFWDTSTSWTSNSDGGTGKNTEDMQKKSTFTGWDFDNIWKIESNSYPTLQSP